MTPVRLSKRMTLMAMVAALVTSAAATSSHGSSPDAWNDFRAAVEQACRAMATSKRLVEVQIVIDLFGSESYGVGVLRAKDSPKANYRVYACIYDKKTKRAELTSGFDAPLPRP